MLSWVSSRVLSHCIRAEKQARSGPEALSVVELLNNLQRGKKLVARQIIEIVSRKEYLF
jgi:hypothetical protein